MVVSRVAVDMPARWMARFRFEARFQVTCRARDFKIEITHLGSYIPTYPHRGICSMGRTSAHDLSFTNFKYPVSRLESNLLLGIYLPAAVSIHPCTKKSFRAFATAAATLRPETLFPTLSPCWQIANFRMEHAAPITQFSLSECAAPLAKNIIRPPPVVPDAGSSPVD